MWVHSFGEAVFIFKVFQNALKIETTACSGMSVDCLWNVMEHEQKWDFVFRWNGRVNLNRRGRQFSRLLAAEVCASACRVCTARASLRSAVMWRLLVTHSILLFPLSPPVRHRVPSHFNWTLPPYHCTCHHIAAYYNTAAILNSHEGRALVLKGPRDVTELYTTGNVRIT
jgi:hypothetical protein